jgi:DNA replication factor GINS
MYDLLFEIWKIEKLNEELQPLKPDFYEKAFNFLKKLNENDRTIDPNSMRSILLKIERERVNKIISELVEARFKKIYKSLIEDTPLSLDCLTKEEENICNKMVEGLQFLNIFRAELLQGKALNKSNIRNEIAESKILLRFNKDVPAIMGADMKPYGPFFKEDLAILPIENANALINRDVAKKINLKKWE